MKKLGWLALVVVVSCGGGEMFVGPLVYLGESCGIPGVTFDNAFCVGHRADAGKKVSARGERVQCGGVFAKGICAHVLSATIEVPARAILAAPAAPALQHPPGTPAPIVPAPIAAPIPPRPVLRPITPARPPLTRPIKK